MSKKKKISKGQQRRLARKQKWKRDDETVKNMHRLAPAYKAILKMRGCELKFYDYLDSYGKQFREIAESAVLKHSSLNGVYEIPEGGDAMIHKKDDWEQLFFDLGDEHGEEYISRDASANLRGSMTAFRATDGNVFSLVSVENSNDSEIVHAELKYGLKIAALTHEIGHVVDLESGTNIDTENLTMDVVEAEVFAHVYALNFMAAADLWQSYLMLKEALVEASESSGLLAEVSNIVLERLPDHKFVDWNEFMNEPATDEEILALSPPLQRLLPQ